MYVDIGYNDMINQEHVYLGSSITVNGMYYWSRSILV